MNRSESKASFNMSHVFMNYWRVSVMKRLNRHLFINHGSCLTNNKETLLMLKKCIFRMYSGGMSIVVLNGLKYCSRPVSSSQINFFERHYTICRWRFTYYMTLSRRITHHCPRSAEEILLQDRVSEADTSESHSSLLMLVVIDRRLEFLL